MDLYIYTATPPSFQWMTIAMVVATLAVVLIGILIQWLWFGPNKTTEERTLASQNTQLWIGHMGVFGACLLVAILVFTIFAARTTLYYCKLMASVTRTFLQDIGGQTTVALTKVDKLATLRGSVDKIAQLGLSGLNTLVKNRARNDLVSATTRT